MATYYVVCINKHPTHQDPHNRIQQIGTNTASGTTSYTKKWPLADVITAIDKNGDTFWSTDKKGDRVKCITAVHSGNKYVKTENDGIQPDNLLAKPECP
jgi:hypothetical protein